MPSNGFIIKCSDCNNKFIKTSNGHKRCQECVQKRKKILLQLKYESLKSKTINTKRRLCIGIYCRGEEYFNSINGHRLCIRCRTYIQGFQDVYKL